MCPRAGDDVAGPAVRNSFQDELERTASMAEPQRDPAEKGRVRSGIHHEPRPRTRRRIRRRQSASSDDRCFALPGAVRPAVAAIFVLVASCGLNDSRPPWDTAQMVSELMSELRQFEGLTTNLDQVEVLAWRVDARDAKDRVPREDLHGTWHAYRRYDHAPTVREICDFAAVDFSTRSAMQSIAAYPGTCESCLVPSSQ